MGVYLNTVESLLFELESVKENIKSASNKEDYIRYVDILRKLSMYFHDNSYLTYENKKYKKEIEKKNKKNLKNIISNRNYIDLIDESLKEDIKKDDEFVEHKEIGLDEMILNIKYFLKPTDKDSYDLFLKILAYGDLYETNIPKNEFIYDNRTRRSFIVLKNTNDINAELNIIYMLSMLTSENLSDLKYTDYTYLNDFSKYKAIYNELLFIDTLPMSRKDDVARIYKKMLLKAKAAVMKIKKINVNDYKDYINDYRYLISLLFAVSSLENSYNKKKIDRYIDSNKVFNSKMEKEIGIPMEEVVDDFKKCYTKHINR